MSSMIITDEGASFFINGKPHSCSSDHASYPQIMEAAKEQNWDVIPDLINIQKAVSNFCSSTDSDIEASIVVTDDSVLYNGNPIGGPLVDRILSMMCEGFNIDPMVNFLANLYENPSDVAVKELYLFLEKAQLPITEDGHFLAYKRVNDNYTSCHDGKTDNSIGAVLEMARNQVDSNRYNTCSYGFHFCSYDYLRSFSGSRTIVLKINPRDVVSIPSDYDNTKGRACRYLVEGEVDADAVRERNVLGEAGSVVNSSRDIPTADGFDSAAVQSTFIAGYRDGYGDGKQKLIKIDLLPGDYANGYDAGYKDGRGHKSRKYK